MSEEKKLDESLPSPQHRHRTKVVKEKAARKANVKVAEEWLEVTGVKFGQNGKKGGKVRSCKKMNNGNVHRELIGFEKDPYMASILEKAKKDGKLELV
jgi:hypothetical protein